jgi:DTW domain-containing protein YfiP
VVFLQHVREARVSIGTARIARLGLLNSELHEGVEFEGHPRIAELIARPGTALLFPGEGAVAPDALERPPETLLVIDGTWPQARKMMSLNPAFRSLPRIGFVPRRPGNYRIRREPAAHCVATVEAVVEVLAAFERDESRFAPLIRAFDSMVEAQIAARAARTTPARRRLKPCDPWWSSAAIPDLDALWPNLVAIAGEANAHGRDSGLVGRPELVQLAAMRLATGETFNAFLAPRRQLAANAARHLEVPAESLLGGDTVERVLNDWNRFVAPDDRLIGWGMHGFDLLAEEGWRPAAEPIDMRLIAAHRFKRRPGTAEAAAIAAGGIVNEEPPAPGRAGRTLRAINALTQAMLAEKRSAMDGAGAKRQSRPENGFISSIEAP